MAQHKAECSKDHCHKCLVVMDREELAAHVSTCAFVRCICKEKFADAACHEAHEAQCPGPGVKAGSSLMTGGEARKLLLNPATYEVTEPCVSLLKLLVETPVNVRFIDCEFYDGPRDDPDCPFRPVQLYLADGNGKEIVPLTVIDTGLSKDELLNQIYDLTYSADPYDRIVRSRTIEKFYSDDSCDRKTCHQITRMISDYVEV
jgi:hypothetical protein